MGILMFKLLKKLFKKPIMDIDWLIGDVTWLPDDAVVNEQILENRRNPAKLPVGKKTKIKS
jgi:hypothetical protein